MLTSAKPTNGVFPIFCARSVFDQGNGEGYPTEPLCASRPAALRLHGQRPFQRSVLDVYPVDESAFQPSTVEELPTNYMSIFEIFLMVNLTKPAAIIVSFYKVRFSILHIRSVIAEHWILSATFILLCSGSLEI